MKSNISGVTFNVTSGEVKASGGLNLSVSTGFSDQLLGEEKTNRYFIELLNERTKCIDFAISHNKGLLKLYIDDNKIQRLRVEDLENVIHTQSAAIQKLVERLELIESVQSSMLPKQEKRRL